ESGGRGSRGAWPGSRTRNHRAEAHPRPVRVLFASLQTSCRSTNAHGLGGMRHGRPHRRDLRVCTEERRRSSHCTTQGEGERLSFPAFREGIDAPIARSSADYGVGTGGPFISSLHLIAVPTWRFAQRTTTQSNSGGHQLPSFNETHAVQVGKRNTQ